MGREREGERRGREGVTRLNDKKRTKRHAVGQSQDPIPTDAEADDAWRQTTIESYVHRIDR